MDAGSCIKEGLHNGRHCRGLIETGGGGVNGCKSLCLGGRGGALQEPLRPHSSWPFTVQFYSQGGSLNACHSAISMATNDEFKKSLTAINDISVAELPWHSGRFRRNCQEQRLACVCINWCTFLGCVCVCMFVHDSVLRCLSIHYRHWPFFR